MEFGFNPSSARVSDPAETPDRRSPGGRRPAVGGVARSETGHNCVGGVARSETGHNCVGGVARSEIGHNCVGGVARSETGHDCAAGLRNRHGGRILAVQLQPAVRGGPSRSARG